MDGLRHIIEIKFNVVHKTKKSRGKLGMKVVVGSRDDLCAFHTLNQRYHFFPGQLLSFFIMQWFDKMILIDALG